MLLAAETIFEFDLKALICFITVCLSHVETEKDLSKCKKITTGSKIQQSVQ